jgi:toxin ParE1/3/4
VAKVKITPLAETDLEDIWTYIATHSIESANRTISDLMKTFNLLAESPALGRDKPELIVNVRSFPHKKYIVFYFPTDDGVEIFRVLHAARNIEDVFADYFEGLDE